MKEGVCIREAAEGDLRGLLALYTQLHGNAFPAQMELARAVWREIQKDGRHHVIVAQADGKVAASCVCVIVPNLTHGQRPYALVENVVTDAAYRRRGFAAACLDYAKELAQRERCYKIMLMTGSREEGVMRFYERAGYNREDKTAFIQWL